MKEPDLNIPSELAEAVASLASFKSEARVIYAQRFGGGYNKGLYIGCDGAYIVEDHGEVICKAMSAVSAIEAYYSIQPR